MENLSQATCHCYLGLLLLLCPDDLQTARWRQTVIQTVTSHIASAEPVFAAVYACLPDFAIPENVTDLRVKSVTRVRERSWKREPQGSRRRAAGDTVGDVARWSGGRYELWFSS